MQFMNLVLNIIYRSIVGNCLVWICTKYRPNFKWVVISTGGRNLVAKVVFRFKIPPVGQNDSVCEVNLQMPKSRVTSDRLIVVLFNI